MLRPQSAGASSKAWGQLLKTKATNSSPLEEGGGGGGRGRRSSVQHGGSRPQVTATLLGAATRIGGLVGRHRQLRGKGRGGGKKKGRRRSNARGNRRQSAVVAGAGIPGRASGSGSGSGSGHRQPLGNTRIEPLASYTRWPVASAAGALHRAQALAKGPAAVGSRLQPSPELRQM